MDLKGSFEVRAVYLIVQVTQHIDYHGNKKSGTQDAGKGPTEGSFRLIDKPAYPNGPAARLFPHITSCLATLTVCVMKLLQNCN